MCSNMVTFYVERGLSYRPVNVMCGRTDPWGGRAICDDCSNDALRRAMHEAQERDSRADNEAMHSAGCGDI